MPVTSGPPRWWAPFETAAEKEDPSDRIGIVVGIMTRLHETLWTAAGLLALSARGMPLKQLAPSGLG